MADESTSPQEPATQPPTGGKADRPQQEEPSDVKGIADVRARLEGLERDLKSQQTEAREKNRIAIVVALIGAISGISRAIIGQYRFIFPKPASYTLGAVGTEMASVKVKADTAHLFATVRGKASASLQSRVGELHVLLTMDQNQMCDGYAYNPLDAPIQSGSVSAGPILLPKGREVEFAVEGKNNKGSAITAEVSVEVAPR